MKLWLRKVNDELQPRKYKFCSMKKTDFVCVKREKSVIADL